ncbi:MAG: LysR family transcriptional regulator [Pseudomonadota bacterium]
MSFHTVARLGGISAAAEHLGQAKSGISRHVAQLEAHFGVRLLERGARSVSLTPIGAQLDVRIASILAEVDLLGDLAREESVGISGNVSIAATPEFGGLLAVHLFPKVQALYPDLSMAMRPSYGYEDMQDPGTDVAFRVGSVADDRLVVRELGVFRRVLVASPVVAQAHMLAGPQDLTGLPCLTFQGRRPGATWRFEGAGGAVDVDVTGGVSVLSFTTLKQLAIAGQGFAFLPDFMVQDALGDGRLIRVLPRFASVVRPIYMTFRPGARRVARVDAFLKVAEEVVPGMCAGAESRA